MLLWYFISQRSPGAGPGAGTHTVTGVMTHDCKVLTARRNSPSRAAPSSGLLSTLQFVLRGSPRAGWSGGSGGLAVQGAASQPAQMWSLLGGSVFQQPSSHWHTACAPHTSPVPISALWPLGPRDFPAKCGGPPRPIASRQILLHSLETRPCPRWPRGHVDRQGSLCSGG